MLGDWRIPLAVAAAGTAIALRRPLVLADAPSCPGLFDFAVVIALRTSGDSTVGTVLSVFNIVLLFGGLLGLCRILGWATGSRLATIAVGLATATSPAIVAASSPTAAAATATCAACWLAWRKALRSRTSAYQPISASTCATLGSAAAAAPGLSVPLAIAGGWLSWRTGPQQSWARQVQIGGAVLGVLIVSTVVLLFLHGTSAPVAAMCMLPVAQPVGITTILSGIVEAAPLPSALAVLGVWVSLMSFARAPLILLLAFVIAFSLLAGYAAGGLVPAALTFWSFCAVGLADASRALSGTAGRRAGAFALATAVVVLQYTEMRSIEAPADRQPQGHYALSRGIFLQLVETLPAGAVVVAEDAVTALLGRALPSRVRIRYELHTTPADKLAVARQLSDSRVFALPRAQRRLQHLGFRLVAVDGPVSGLAEVRPGGVCSAPLTTEWRVVPELTDSRQFTMTTDDPQSRGPLVLFAASQERPDVRAVDWPPGALRGFHPRSFTQADAADAGVLSEELKTYGADPNGLGGPPQAPHVARIEMWRTPEAPLELTVGLGVIPNQLMARLADTAAAQTLTLCPSFEHEIQAIVPRP